jgi:hypothetical protein
MRPVLLLVVVLLFALTPADAADVGNRDHSLLRTGVPQLPRVAPSADVKSILEEFALPAPPLCSDLEPPTRFAFFADAIKPYATDVSIEDILKDVERYKLRAAVLRAFQTIRDTSLTADPKAPKPLNRVPSPLTDATKKEARDTQEAIALAIARLELALDALTVVESLRAKEPRRWQAHYDYALGQVRLRMAMLNEFNKLLGDVRTESLPALPVGALGWRLVPSEQMQSKKQVQDLAASAVSGFESIATNHKGTPWAMLARQTLLTPPGLKWEAVGK